MLNESDNKRVFFINSTCGTGSTGRIVTGLMGVLTSYGYTCMAAYGRGKAPEGYETYRIGSDFDVGIKFFYLLNQPARGAAGIKSVTVGNAAAYSVKIDIKIGAYPIRLISFRRLSVSIRSHTCITVGGKNPDTFPAILLKQI